MTESADILLIDDEPSDVELALHALARFGISDRVKALHDGAEALEYLFCTGRYADREIADAPKVVLVDLKLPLIDGFEVLRQIRTDRRTRCLPVAILSTSKEDRDIDEAYNLGANSYIVKPIGFDQFIEALHLVARYWLTLNTPPTGS